jgi:hypothetical protein
MLPYLLRGPGYTVYQKITKLFDLPAEISNPKIMPGVERACSPDQNKYTRNPTTHSHRCPAGAKKFYLFEGLPSVGYGEGGCHRDQSGNHIIYGHEPRPTSKGGILEFSFGARVNHTMSDGGALKSHVLVDQPDRDPYLHRHGSLGRSGGTRNESPATSLPI